MNLKGKALKYMKSLKIKKIYGVIKYILVILSVCLMLSSCNKPQTTELANSETKKEIEFDIEKENLMSRPHVTGSFFGEIPRHSGGCI